MRGLFLSNFYSAIENIKLFMVIVVVVGIGVLVTGNPTVQELFVYITITLLSVNAVASSRKDAISNWNKFEMTIPVSKKEIVKCKYLSYAFWVLIGTIFTLIITVATMLLHGNDNLLYGMSNFYSMFSLGIGLSLLAGSIFYPLSYLVGVDKSETILIISILIAIGIAIGIN